MFTVKKPAAERVFLRLITLYVVMAYSKLLNDTIFESRCANTSPFKVKIAASYLCFEA